MRKPPKLNASRTLTVIAIVVFTAAITGATLWRDPTKQSGPGTAKTYKEATDPKTTKLEVKEWSIVLNINTPGAYYEDSTDGNIYLSTERLEELTDQVKGCKSGLHGLFVNQQLQEVSIIETTCMPEATELTKEIGHLKQILSESLKSAQKI